MSVCLKVLWVCMGSVRVKRRYTYIQKTISALQCNELHSVWSARLVIITQHGRLLPLYCPDVCLRSFFQEQLWFGAQKSTQIVIFASKVHMCQLRVVQKCRKALISWFYWQLLQLSTGSTSLSFCDMYFAFLMDFSRSYRMFLRLAVAGKGWTVNFCVCRISSSKEFVMSVDMKCNCVLTSEYRYKPWWRNSCQYL